MPGWVSLTRFPVTRPALLSNFTSFHSLSCLLSQASGHCRSPISVLPPLWAHSSQDLPTSGFPSWRDFPRVPSHQPQTAPGFTLSLPLPCVIFFKDLLPLVCEIIYWLHVNHLPPPPEQDRTAFQSRCSVSICGINKMNSFGHSFRAQSSNAFSKRGKRSLKFLGRKFGKRGELRQAKHGSCRGKRPCCWWEQQEPRKTETPNLDVYLVRDVLVLPYPSVL